ncbi:cytochrome P450 [Amycolatopsis australiensis]|uniref:Cytochrome P450 n=1 Tax=Amycolatopsis australiensis TaxID=546364 RepID=A0A1K1RM61_9PSEU|nr:cytochrome P450 [Amycolatopsis australiensis]SFW72940.1 Cytochrome P450 [Amycolatopsis australiensis]
MRLNRPTDPDAIDLDAVDFIDSTLYGDGEPHAIWHAMRQRDPLRWQAVGDELGFWSVTKMADADLVLRDHTKFTSQRGTMLFLLGKDDPARGRQMAATDPPRHTRMRVPLQRALAPKAIERYRDAIREEVRRVLAPALTGEPYDFAANMMVMPMATAGRIMDLPREDWPRLTRLTAMSIAPDDPEFAGEGGAQATLEAAHRELFAYFHDIVRARRRNLGDDLISLLLTMDVEGSPIEVGAVLANCYSLLLGANITTPFVPIAALDHLIGTPQLRDWMNDPDALTLGVDEAVRWASPANHFMRYAIDDVEIRGKQISAGDAVVVWLGAANRDEEYFDDPFTFDYRRKPNKHIAFGIGPHYCVGHSVARLSLRTLFEELFTTFEDFEPAGEVQHLRSNFVAGIKHMPIVARVRQGALAGLGS